MGGIGTKEFVQLFCCKVGRQKAFMQQTGMNKCMFPPPSCKKGAGNGRVPPVQTLKKSVQELETRSETGLFLSHTVSLAAA